MAIITRWRIPPESWYGQARLRRTGSRSASSEQFDRPGGGGLPSIRRWRRRTPEIWRPTGITGLSDVMGSWKIMPISLPRTRRSWAGESVSRPRPARRTPSPRTVAESGSRPMTDSPKVLLPHPDSPTTPTISPGSTRSDTSSRASTSPPCERKLTERPRTSSTGSVTAGSAVERVLQPVAEQVEAERRDEDGQPGEDREERSLRGVRLRGGEHDAPGRRRWLDAEAEEGEHRFGNDRERQEYGRLHDDRVEDVGQYVPDDDPATAPHRRPRRSRSPPPVPRGCRRG